MNAIKFTWPFPAYFHTQASKVRGTSILTGEWYTETKLTDRCQFCVSNSPPHRFYVNDSLPHRLYVNNSSSHQFYGSNSLTHQFYANSSPPHQFYVNKSPLHQSYVNNSPLHQFYVNNSPPHQFYVNNSPPHQFYVNNSPPHQFYVNNSSPHQFCVNNSPPHRFYVNNSPPHRFCVNNSPPHRFYVNNSPPHQFYVNNSSPHQFCVNNSPPHSLFFSAPCWLTRMWRCLPGKAWEFFFLILVISPGFWFGSVHLFCFLFWILELVLSLVENKFCIGSAHVWSVFVPFLIFIIIKMKNNFFEVFKTIDQTFFFFLQYSTKSPANSRNRKIKEDS